MTRSESSAQQMVSLSLGMAVARDRLILAVTSLFEEIWIPDKVERSKD